MEVAAWRERVAQDRNVPRSRVLKDEALFEIAAQAPQTIDDLDALRGVPKGFAGSRGAQSLVEAVRLGLSLPASAVPDIERGPPPPSLRRHRRHAPCAAQNSLRGARRGAEV